MALVNGAVGVVVALKGKLLRVLVFKIVRGKIAQLEVVAEPARLDAFGLTVIDH